MKSVPIIFFWLLFVYSHIYAQKSEYPYSGFIDKEALYNAIKGHITVLGSDSLQGRATGRAGAYLSAEYIRNQLKDMGIPSVPSANDYFQKIPMHGSIPTPESDFKVYFSDDTLNLNYPEDYLLDKTGSQTFIPAPAPMVFIGYGIHAPEYDYSDYIDIDVSGKVVVFLSGEPESDDPAYFNGTQPTVYSYLESKQRIAISRGAVGSIMILHPGRNPGDRWKHLQKEYSFEHVSLAYQPMSHFSAILNPDAAEKILRYSNYDYNKIYQLNKYKKLTNISLQTSLSFKGKFIERDFIGHNVIGLIKSPINRVDGGYVAVSAHYDHLGVGRAVNGDSIYNGVMDNAIGTAGVLELARYLNQNKRNLANSVLLLFFTGEEKGLLGSAYYIDHPVVPLFKTMANINVDGMAAFDEFKSVVGLGAELSSLGQILKKTARKAGITVKPIPEMFLNFESFSRSDQMSFAKGGVPSILVIDGIDYRNYTAAQGLRQWITWNSQIYHTPADDLNQPINFAAVDQHFHFMYNYIIDVINTEDKIHWYEGTPFENVRLRSIAEKK